MSENLDQVETTEDAAQMGAPNLGGADLETDVEEKKPSKWRGSQVLFGLIGLGLAGTYFMYVKTGPQNAAAAPQVQQAHKDVSSFLSAGPANVKTMEKMLRNTEKVIQQFLAYPAVTQVALEDLKTNPFLQAIATAKPEEVSEAAAAKQKEAERQAALTAVRSLNLQSVLVSERNRSCMVNNALYLEGQQVDQFTIEKIAPGSVVVRRGAYRFELQMNR
jgi:hypothetical protein